MITNILSFFIVIFANIIGSFSGMGGGIIIKPLVSILCHLSLPTVIFYSNLSVLVMCVTSLSYSFVKKTTHYDKTVWPIAAGSFVGGLIGTVVLSYVMQFNHDFVQDIQIIVTIITIICAMFYQWKGHPVKHCWISPYRILLLGFIMGFFSVILGIGGGPINVWLLMMLMNFSLKQATSYSLISVVVSVSIRLCHDFLYLYTIPHEWVTMGVFMVSAFIGAIIGFFIKKRLSNTHFKTLYLSTLTLVVIINIINLFV